MYRATISLLCVFLSLFVLVLVKKPEKTIGQVTEPLALTPKSNGFYGTYKTLDKEYSFETSHPSDDFFLTRILRQDGSIIAEALRNSNVMTVKLPEIQVDFDTSKKSSPPRSEETKNKILAFMGSSEAKVIRNIFAALVKEKDRVRGSHLKGFTAIVMVVGDDPGSSKIKTDIKDMFFKQGGESNMLKIPAILNTAGDCKGCCGPGCWGCTGCYTSACWAHDHCVEQQGHVLCLGILDDAIASMLECPAA